MFTKQKRRIRLGTTNPLYDAWLGAGLVPDEFGGWKPQDFRTNDHFALRRQAVSDFAWAVPSPQAIRWAADRCRRIVEVGAGRGYWAKLLAEAGCDVVAYDQAIIADGLTGKNDWHPNCREMFFPVQQGYPQRASEHEDRTLFLCWPPYNTAMAADALKCYFGSELLYVGEGAGGCCGDERFWEFVEEEWQEIGECAIPQWYGIHDWMWLYRRK